MSSVNDRYVTKLSLNSAALERLLGGPDGQLEVDLRQAVVENLFTKHVKAIMRDETIQARLTQIQNEFNKQLASKLESMIGQWQPGRGYDRHFQFSPKITEALEAAAREKFDAIFQKAIDDKVASMQANIEAMVAARVTANLNTKIQMVVTERLRQLQEMAAS